jgi:hypothetical protein
VGITIKSDRLELILEKAVRLAESNVALPEIWLDRVDRISESPFGTYIAALGTALLAKASDGRIDALAIKAKAGPTAYSMRGVVKVLAARAPDYGYHLGVTGPEPLNNQPWFGSSRVDRITNLHVEAKPFHRDLVRYLSDLNRLSQEQAFEALAAFIGRRMTVAAEERARATTLRAKAGASFSELLEVVETFVWNDPEGGRRGQALVAAVLDLAHNEVDLAAINDPRMFDVAVKEQGLAVLGIDVKQKAVDEASVMHLAREAAARSVDKVLMVALAQDQRPLDRPRIAATCLDDFGVVAGVFEGVPELLGDVALQAPVSLAEFTRSLPEQYLRRMQEHGVSADGQQFWVDLCNGLSEQGLSRSTRRP